MPETDNSTYGTRSRSKRDVVFHTAKKTKCMTVDDIIKVCSDFYTTDDVEKDRLTLLKYVTQKRLPKHKGSDAEIRTKTITAIVKLCLDPASSIPVFCALNLTRLPPVDTDHVDVSVTALLAEISALRREVRAITQLKVEVDQLKTLLCSNVSSSRQERSDASRCP